MVGRRLLRDVLALRNIDAYVAAAVAVMVATAGIVGDVPDDIRWSVALAALAVLIFRSTAPTPPTATFDHVANDRAAFDDQPLSSRWESARSVYVFAPSAVNLLASPGLDVLRRTVLSDPLGELRVVILNDHAADAIKIAGRHLDDGVDYPEKRLSAALRTTMEQLRTLQGWNLKGKVSVRTLDFNPGFSLLITDPLGARCSVIVEMHGFHHETTGSRMHLDLSRSISERWTVYWIEQFEHIWRTASPVDLSAGE